jgi:hypothetical protein
MSRRLPRDRQSTTPCSVASDSENDYDHPICSLRTADCKFHLLNEAVPVSKGVPPANTVTAREHCARVSHQVYHQVNSHLQQQQQQQQWSVYSSQLSVSTADALHSACARTAALMHRLQPSQRTSKRSGTQVAAILHETMEQFAARISLQLQQ